MRNAKTIQIFLPDGNLRGVRELGAGTGVRLRYELGSYELGSGFGIHGCLPCFSTKNQQYQSLTPFLPINEAEANREVLRTAHQSISDALAQGALVCYFPEGRLTDNGALQAFQSGVEHIMRQHHVPVVPLALVGLWESIFSKNPNTHGAAYALRRLFSPVELRSAAAIDSSQCTAATLQLAVEGLLVAKKG